MRTFLADRFPEPWLALGAEEHRDLVDELAALRISGGAIYDALVSASARAAGATLVTCDRRAAAIYERLRVVVELLGD